MGTNKNELPTAAQQIKVLHEVELALTISQNMEQQAGLRKKRFQIMSSLGFTAGQTFRFCDAEDKMAGLILKSLDNSKLMIYVDAATEQGADRIQQLFNRSRDF